MKITFLKKEDMSITILAKTNLVVYVDKALVNILGSRIWTGRPLTDHLYENDRVLLQSKLINITEKINAGFKKIHEIEPFYLRILKTSDSSQETKTSKISSNTITFRDMIGRQFLIFKVDIKPDTVEFKNVEDSEKTSSSSNIQPVSCHDLNLETCFTLKLSFPCIAYNQKQMNSSFQSEDSNEDRTFITEHNTNLKITRVENRVCELLGFLPQDLANRSLLKLIHPEDLEKIKKIHSDMYHKNQLQNFESYRWRCFNGSFVTVKSQWSCLKHPWNEHIDYIVGKHLIIDEPSNKNIFDESSKEDRGMLYRVDQDNNKTKVSFKENLKIVEKEIIELISRKIPSTEEETQILGQNMVKLINNKSLSAHFCNEQMRKMKKRQRKKFWRMKQVDTLRMLHKKNRLPFDEEPYYFHINSKLNASLRERSKRLNSYSMRSSSRIKHQRIGKIAKKFNAKSLGSFSTKNKYIIKQNKKDGKKDSSNNEVDDQSQMSSPVPDMLEGMELNPEMLRDKDFYMHFTICKYIDGLPDEWATENDELDELNAACNKVGANIDSGSTGSTNSSDNPKDSYKRALSSQPLNTSRMKENADQNLSNSESDKSKTDSSQKNAKKFKSNDFTKNYIEFLLKKSDKENIITKKPKHTEADEMKKGLSTISSKSHSKIVLFNEQEYEEDDEEQDEEDFDDFENIQPPTKANNEGANLESYKNEEHNSAKNLTDLNETIKKNSDDSNNNMNANLKSTSNDSGSNSNSNNDKKNTSSNEVLSTNSTLNSSLNKETNGYSKFTEEALAKHTMEQEEMYIKHILRKIKNADVVKYFSGKISILIFIET
jgi:hypothetical protein